MFDMLTQNVYKIECGSITGTCFLINKTTAITVYHVVREHLSSEISLFQNCKFVTKAKLSDTINDDCKSKDFAILFLDEEIEAAKYLEFSLFDNIPVGTQWSTRGYPKVKECNGENIMLHADNVVNQHLNEITSKKIDIELNHSQKWQSYEGMSGAPLIINDKVVGIINSELISGHLSKELKALSVKSLKDILIANDISFLPSTSNMPGSFDMSGAEGYEGLLNSYDIRNLQEKLSSVCNTISEIRIAYYCRELASGKAELQRYSDQAVSAVKFRIFETCQKELLDFVEKQQKSELTISEIDDLINIFSAKAKTIIEIRSLDYDYPFKNLDLMRKIVLDLINDCFLSFDIAGIYEG